MAKKKIALVTGVSSFWGRQVACSLLARGGSPAGDDFPHNGTEPEGGWHVIGLDAEPPPKEIQGLDYIQADVRNPLMVDLLREEKVDTVCHLVFEESLKPAESVFDLNVMGTLKMLGACAEAGVRKVVLKSSTAVYGALPTNPAFLTEQHPLQGSRGYGYTRDLVEIEAFCNGFRRQTPELILTVIRFASVIGPEVESPLTRFLRDARAPILLGFDPMMQLIHERDVIDALVYAAAHDVPGVFNVAAEGVMPLTRLMALASKAPIPIFHLFAYWSENVLGKGSLDLLPMEPDYLRYPWVADLSRMRDELGFTPRYTAEEALREFAGQQRLHRYLPESAALAYDEKRLRDTLERRRHMRKAAGEEDAHEPA